MVLALRMGRLEAYRYRPIWCRRDRGWPHPLYSWREWWLDIHPGVFTLYLGPFVIEWWRFCHPNDDPHEREASA